MSMSIYVVDPRKNGEHCPGIDTAFMWQKPDYQRVSFITPAINIGPRAVLDNNPSIAAKFNPGVATIQMDSPGAAPMDCICFAGVNWSVVTNIQILAIAEGQSSSAEIYNTGAIPYGDMQPVMLKIPKNRYHVLYLYLTVSDELRIGQLAYGESLLMPNSPSVGFEPAAWNWGDKITQMLTEGRLIGNSTITPMGSSQKMKFPFIPREFMDNYWRPLLDQAHGKPIWCCWNWNNRPTDCIYGDWVQQSPKYGALSEINMTIMGAA